MIKFIKSKRILIVTILISFLIIFVFIKLNSNSDNLVEKEISYLYKSTIPPNSKIIKDIESIQQRNSLISDWRFETSLNPKAYKEWLIGNLLSGYNKLDTNNTNIHFKKVLVGDILDLEVEMSEKSPITMIYIKFSAQPF